MNNVQSKKQIIIADSREPEKMVLSSILGRLGYTVNKYSSVDEIMNNLDSNPNLIIINGSIEGAEHTAFSLGNEKCRVILLTPTHENAPDFTGFVDATEHILRGIGVTIPEIVMVVNDFISPVEGKGIKRQPRVPGGYGATIRFNDADIQGFIFNISSSGAFVEMSDPPPQKSIIDLEFSLPGHDNAFFFKSKVTWTVLPDESKAMRSPPGCGVFFMNMTEEQHLILEQFVNNKGHS